MSPHKLPALKRVSNEMCIWSHLEPAFDERHGFVAPC